MKRIYSLILLAMLCVPVMILAKPTMIEKQAKKKAQEFKKAGWRIMPGELPMEEQLIAFYTMLIDTDEKGEPRYINVQNVSNTCNTLAEAEEQALILGRFEMLRATEPSYQISIMESINSEPDGEIIEDISSSRTISTYGYTTEMDRVGDDSYTKYTCPKGVMIEYTTQNGISNSVYHWDVLREFCLMTPMARETWCAFKIYRKTDKGYEVYVEMCSDSPRQKILEEVHHQMKSNPIQLDLDSLFND